MIRIKRYIYCSGKSSTFGTTPVSKLVNQIGKYIYNHLDGAFQYKKSGNTFDVYTTLLYEIKEEYGGTKNDVQEMTVNISITCYQSKLRIDTIEMDPDEMTIGFDLLNPGKFSDLESIYIFTMNKVRKRIEKAYENSIILY